MDRTCLRTDRPDEQVKQRLLVYGAEGEIALNDQNLSEGSKGQ